MEHQIKINEFVGPMDLLLYLIKENSIDIMNINIVEITDQYLNYIETMEKLNLTIASEYLTVASELLYIKSNLLIPNKKLEENLEEQFINRIFEYKKYKEVAEKLNKLEKKRRLMFSPLPRDLSLFLPEKKEIKKEDLNKLIKAFKLFLIKKEVPLYNTISYTEYSVTERLKEIKEILKNEKQIEWTKLFEKFEKNYIIVTFLSILELAKTNYISIIQTNNFNQIILVRR